MIEFVPNSSEELYNNSLERLIRVTVAEDVKPLSMETVQQHALGIGATITGKVLSYAGITGFAEVGGDKLAVVGGVITHPAARRRSLAMLTVGQLVAAASEPEWTNAFEHSGFVARCNSMSESLFEKLGFTSVSHHAGRTTMQRMLPALASS